eukprot:472403_1
MAHIQTTPSYRHITTSVPPALEYIPCVIGVLLEISTFIIVFQCTKKLLLSNKHRINEKFIFVQTVNKGQKKQRIKKKNVHISFDPFIRFGTILSLICYFITSSGYLSGMFMKLNSVPYNIHQLMQNTAFVIICQIMMFTWHLGRISVNFVFVQRLQSSFKDTPWMYSKRIFDFLRFMLLLLLLLLLISSVTRALILSHAIGIGHRILIILHIHFVTLDIIFFVLLTVLFNKKVVELIKAYYVLYTNSIQNEQQMNTLNLNDINLEEVMTAETSLSLPTKSGNTKQSTSSKLDVPSLDVYQNISDSARSRLVDDDLCERENRIDERRKHYKYGHTEKELIHSMVQHSTLVSVSVIASMFTLTFGIIGWFVAEDQVSRGLSPARTVGLYGDFSILIECFINALCLYLQFPFALNLYRSLCCAHKVCLSCVAKCVETSKTEGECRTVIV